MDNNINKLVTKLIKSWIIIGTILTFGYGLVFYNFIFSNLAILPISIGIFTTLTVAGIVGPLIVFNKNLKKVSTTKKQINKKKNICKENKKQIVITNKNKIKPCNMSKNTSNIKIRKLTK